MRKKDKACHIPRKTIKGVRYAKRLSYLHSVKMWMTKETYDLMRKTFGYNQSVRHPHPMWDTIKDKINIEHTTCTET